MTESIAGLVVDPETYCQFVSAIETLGADLNVAVSVYDAPETQRLGAIHALGAVTDFITEFKDFEAARLHLPLLDLRMALLDAENGVSDPLLEKAKSTAGRPRASSQRQTLRAYASVAMDLFMRAGFDQNKAAAEVARSLRSYGFKREGRGDKEITGTTVKNWREKTQGQPPEDFDAARYRNVLASVLPHPKKRGDPEAAARRLLAKLPEVVKS